MPAPKTAAGYDMDYFRILDAAKLVHSKGKSFFDLPIGEKSKAERMRFTFYNFRKALEHDAKRHIDKDTRTERRSQYLIAEKLRIKLIQMDNGWVLRVVNATADFTCGTNGLGDALDSVFDQLLADDKATRENYTAQIEAENSQGVVSSDEDGGASLFNLFSEDQ